MWEANVGSFRLDLLLERERDICVWASETETVCKMCYCFVFTFQWLLSISEGKFWCSCVSLVFLSSHCKCKDYWEGKELSKWPELETKYIGRQKYSQELFRKQKLKRNVIKGSSGIKLASFLGTADWTREFWGIVLSCQDVMFGLYPAWLLFPGL